MARDIERNHQALFLHGGPGLSAGVERLWFGNSLPICWWDQPPVTSGASSPFAQLVSAAADQLRAMAEEAGGPVVLIGHSFGGRIAHALVQTAPELVKSIILLGCDPEPFLPLFRLCRRMTEIQGSPVLENTIADATHTLNKRSFEAMILSAAAHPAYPAVYFGPGSASVRDRFLALLPQVQFLNLETFLAVMNDLMNATALAPSDSFGGDVTILLGRYDPVLVVDKAIAAWRRIFPQMQARVMDAGHFLHLELPPEIWWEMRPAGA